MAIHSLGTPKDTRSWERQGPHSPSQLSEGTEPADTLISYFWLPDDKCLLFELFSPCYFVTAARENEYRLSYERVMPMTKLPWSTELLWGFIQTVNGTKFSTGPEITTINISSIKATKE